MVDTRGWGRRTAIAGWIREKRIAARLKRVGHIIAETPPDDLFHPATARCYDPPYESPIERDFAYNFAKYADPSIEFAKQTRISTICGSFVIDFTARVGADIIGFECDGEDFHDEYRDEWRDAVLLGSKGITTIYHMRGADLTYRMEDCLCIISRLEPALFSSRGRVSLQTLASDGALSCNLTDDEVICVLYPPREGVAAPGMLRLVRRSQYWPPGERRFWTSLYQYAVDRGGGNLDDLIAEDRKG